MAAGLPTPESAGTQPARPFFHAGLAALLAGAEPSRLAPCDRDRFGDVDDENPVPEEWS